MKYRIAISILALFLVLFTGFSASAGGHEHGDEDYGVLYDACPGGGKHYMEARGRGNGSESANYNVGTFTYLYTNYLYYNSSLSDMDGYEWY